jgi:hypothetical protein
VKGESLLEEAEFGEEFPRMVGVVAEGGGNILATPGAKQTDGGVSAGGEDLGSGAVPDAAGVFAESDVPHIVEAVFDAPMLAPTLRDPLS